MPSPSFPSLALVLLGAASGCAPGSGIDAPQDGRAPAFDAAPNGANDSSVLAITDLTLSPDLAPAPYPSGPYGNQPGDVFPPMQWVGFAVPDADGLADARPFAPFAAADLRAPGKRWALVTLVDTLCSGCQAGARALAAQGKAFVDGGGVVAVVIESTQGKPATEADVRAWVGTFDSTFTTVKDPDGAPGRTLATVGYYEETFEVDLRTLRIARVVQGSTAAPGPSSVETALADLAGR